MSKKWKRQSYSNQKHVDGEPRKGKKIAKKSPPNEPEIRGWDWTEMGPIFDLWVPSNNEEPYAQILKSRIWDAIGVIDHFKSANRTEWMLAKRQIQRCRKYCLELSKRAKNRHYDWAVWKAIAEIKDDAVFATWLTRHMEYGWS